MGNDSWGGFLKNFLKNKRTPLNSSNREEKVGEKLLNFKLMHRNSVKTVCISTSEKVTY